MKFLIDVVARWLRGSGYDVAEVRDRDACLPDEEILRWAVQDRRILITTDRDLVHLVFRQGMPHSGILLLENLALRKRLDLIERVLEDFAHEFVNSDVIIATTRQIVVRRAKRS